MVDKQNAKIIAFVGLSGTGKSAATDYLGERGIPKVSFGDIVMNALKKENLDITPENERMIREKMRLDPGGDLVVHRAITEIEALLEAGQRRIVIDGLGGWDAYKRLRRDFHGNLTVVALTARRHIRHRRLAQRTEHTLNDQEVDERDYDAIETLGKGGVIAIADYFLADNSSIEQLHSRIDELLREIEF